MLKKLKFKAEDGYLYEISVEQIKFDDKGTNRVKFKVEDLLSKGFLQRIGEDWVQLEGDIKDSHITHIGAEIRMNFDT